MKNPQVVSIIDNKNIIINAGENAGIQAGDIFEIYAQIGLEIYDSITKECLGIIEIKKESVYAYEVAPKMTICKKYQEPYDNSNYFKSILNINEDDALNIYAEDKRIEIGDSLKRKSTKSMINRVSGDEFEEIL